MMNKQLMTVFKASLGGGAFAIALALLTGKTGLEGREYNPYYDVAGVLTVCDGHTGRDIIKTKTYTDAECDALTKADLQRIARQIDPNIKVKLPETVHAAVYTFAYNVGAGAFNSSTMLKKLNAGDTIGACNELQRWVYTKDKNGKPVKWKGLMNRRDVETTVCKWSL